MKVKTLIIQKISELARIDLRALAFFRIGIGFILLYELIVRSFWIWDHYSDFGIMPRGTLLSQYQNLDFWSFLFVNASIPFIWMHFIAHGLCALFLILGFRSRLMMFFCWLLLASLQNRNFMISSGDALLRIAMFWAMFLPVGARYSLDALWAVRKVKVNSLATLASFMILFQMAAVYFFSALLKSGPDWYPDFTATYYALQLDQFRTFFGIWLSQFPEFLHLTTILVFFLELVGPFLFFSPIFTNGLRFVMVIFFAAMHVGFLLCLQIGAFPFVDLMALSLFLPSFFWDFIENKLLYKRGFFILEKIKIIKVLSKLKKLAVQEIAVVNHKITSLIITLLGLLTLWCNIAWLPESGVSLTPLPANVAATLLLNQRWLMFGPNVIKDSGWYVVEGSLVDGSSVDVYNQKFQAVSFTKPNNIADYYINERWRKYLMLLWEQNYASQRPYYANYLCKRWNRKEDNPDRQLKSLKIYFMREVIGPNYQRSPVEKVELWSHDCF
jgi:hypothetical protein